MTFTIDATLPADVITYDTTVLDNLPPGLTFESLTSVTCDQGGGACSPDIGIGDTTVLHAAPGGSGDDVAFFFDDLTSPAAADRVVTITYVAIVADVAAATSGATLTNSAAIVLERFRRHQWPDRAAGSRQLRRVEPDRQRRYDDRRAEHQLGEGRE